MNFSGREGRLYVSLGREAARRRVVRDDSAMTPVETFLGARLHGFTTIVRIEAGTGVIACGSGSAAIGPGDVVALPPGLVSYRFDGPRRVETLAIAGALGAGVIVRAADLGAGAFERSDRDVIEAIRRAPARRAVARPESERTVMRALARIDAEGSRARLATVAHDLGYTADGLTALVRRCTGAGFARWRDALVMARARALLAGRAPVMRVARELELEASYLHRRFAGAHGTTPHRWRGAPTLPERALAHEWDALVRFFAASR